MYAMFRNCKNFKLISAALMRLFISFFSPFCIYLKSVFSQALLIKLDMNYFNHKSFVSPIKQESEHGLKGFIFYNIVISYCDFYISLNSLFQLYKCSLIFTLSHVVFVSLHLHLITFSVMCQVLNTL